MKIMTNSFCDCFLVNQTADGWYLSDGHGFVMEEEEVLELCNNLIKFAKKNNKILKETNIKVEKELYDTLYNKRAPFSKTEKKKTYGYVYLFECKGKYKIGISKNVERRIKELDDRPFPVRLITKSRKIENPIVFEKRLHQQMNKYRIDGEWFALPDAEICLVCDILEEI